MKKIEHIGIAVKDLEKSNELFEGLLGKAHYKVEAVESEDVPIYVAVTRNQNENSVISKCLVDGSERISGNIINWKIPNKNRSPEPIKEEPSRTNSFYLEEI